MDALEKEIHRYFAVRRLKTLGTRSSAGYPSEEDFCRFLTGAAPAEEEARMLEHLKHHAEDEIFVAGTRGLLENLGESEKEAVPAELLRRASALAPKTAPLSCPHCRRAITPFKRPVAHQKVLNALWLLAGAGFFTNSFFMPRYFIQWTVLGALCAMKWIVDTKATKTQILVYKALSEESVGGRVEMAEKKNRDGGI